MFSSINRSHVLLPLTTSPADKFCIRYSIVARFKFCIVKESTLISPFKDKALLPVEEIRLVNNFVFKRVCVAFLR